MNEQQRKEHTYNKHLGEGLIIAPNENTILIVQLESYLRQSEMKKLQEELKTQGNCNVVLLPPNVKLNCVMYASEITKAW